MYLIKISCYFSYNLDIVQAMFHFYYISILKTKFYSVDVIEHIFSKNRHLFFLYLMKFQII